MSLNPGGASSYSWNYSKPDRDDYSLELFGTVVSVQEVQARDYNPNSTAPGRPSTWPDGNPKMNIRIGFADPDGKLKSLTFQKAGKKQAQENSGLHMQLYNLSGRNMSSLVGKTLHLWTWPVHPDDGGPLSNMPWQKGNPRLFGVEEWAEGKFELAAPLPEEFKVPALFCDDGAHGGQAQQMPPMNGNMYAQPRQQAYYQPPAYPQPMPQQQQPYYPQPVYQQQQAYPQYPQQQYRQPAQIQVPQVQPHPMTAQMPQGMDPSVAQAMQAMGAQNVQPVGSVYDADIPF